MFDYKLALQQLCQAENYIGRLKAMIGVRDLVVCGSTVAFKFKGSHKANILIIDYDHDNDLYTMVFFRGVEQVERIDGLYAEDLKPVFERVTGLYLSL